MKTLSVADTAVLLGVPDLVSFVANVEWKHADPIAAYVLPKDSGEKVALARAIANLLLSHGPVLLWITEAGVWPSSQHMDLFNGYRRSQGEVRSLSEAPVHIFDYQEDADVLISILYLGLAFMWDLELCALDRSLAVTIGHDEWLEYRFSSGHENIVPAFRQWVEHSLKLELKT